MTTNDLGRARLLLAPVAFGVAYLLAVALGLLLRAPGLQLAAIWPAAGLSVAVFVRSSGRSRWRFAAALGGVQTVQLLLGGSSVWLAAGLGVVGVIEPYAVAWLLQRLRGNGAGSGVISSPVDLARLVAAAVVGVSLAGLAGAASGAWRQPVLELSTRTASWWVSDVVGILLTAPVILLATGLGRPVRLRRLPEAVLHGMVLLLGVAAVFAARPGSSVASAEYLLLPLLLVAAVRLPPVLTATMVLGAAILADLLTSRGTGPFCTPGGTVHLLALQGFLAVVTVATLALALAVEAQRQTREALEASEALVRELLDAATEQAIVATDLESRITVFNHGAERMFGYRTRDVVGRHVRLLDDHDRTGPGPTPTAAMPVEGFTGERTVRCSDGRRLPVRESVTPVRRGQELVGYLAVATDITAQRQQAEAMASALAQERRAVARLRSLDQAKTDFVAKASHDLRTPLTSILGHLEVLAEDVPQGAGPSLRTIERNAHRLLALIEGLLTVPAFDGGAPRRAVDLGGLVRTVTGSFQPPRDMAVRLQVPSVPVMVWGDPDALERVVATLVGPRADGGGREVSVSVQSRGGHAVMSVHTAAALGTAASPAPDDGPSASVVDTVESHGGSLRVAATPGAGTTVSLTLPTAASEPPAAPAQRSGDDAEYALTRSGT